MTRTVSRMSKTEYDFFGYDQLELILERYIKHFREKKMQGLVFNPLTVIFKDYRKKKTQPQHRYYWVCINELKKALKESGCIYNQEQVHELVKKEAGFTETKELPNGKTIMVTKSIANNSKDATLEDMKELINFIIIFAQENLNYRIKNPMEANSV